jgi:hypothetical protein
MLESRKSNVIDVIHQKLPPDEKPLFSISDAIA